MKYQWFHILLALADGACHGAEIRREVQARTKGEVELYPAMLYGSLEDMKERGFIREIPASAGEDRGRTNRRRNYRITSRGRSALEGEIERIESLARVARRALTKKATP